MHEDAHSLGPVARPSCTDFDLDCAGFGHLESGALDLAGCAMSLRPGKLAVRRLARRIRVKVEREVLARWRRRLRARRLAELAAREEFQ